MVCEIRNSNAERGGVTTKGVLEFGGVSLSQSEKQGDRSAIRTTDSVRDPGKMIDVSFEKLRLALFFLVLGDGVNWKKKVQKESERNAIRS